MAKPHRLSPLFLTCALLWLAVVACDRIGGTNTTRPTVSILSPEPRSSVGTDEVMKVEIVAEDLNGPGVHRVDLQLDGMIVDTFEAAVPQAQLEVAMHPDAPSMPGASTLTAVAYRQDGTESSPVTIALTVVDAGEQAVESAGQALAASAPAESDAPSSPEGSAEASQSTPDRMQVKVSTTSDWTNVFLVGGGEWQDLSVTSASEQADFAEPENGGLSLTQSLARAEAGRRVELTAEAVLASLQSGCSLVFEIERGHVGSTEVEISRFRDGSPSVIAVLTWDGINADEMNTERFAVACDGSPEVMANENVAIAPASEPQSQQSVGEPPPGAEAVCPAGPGNCCGDGVCQTDEGGDWCGDCPEGQVATTGGGGDGDTAPPPPSGGGYVLCDPSCSTGDPTDTCPDDCIEIPSCGDGVVEGDEVCDPPGEVYAMGLAKGGEAYLVCNASCTGSDPDLAILACGDGKVYGLFEECDPPGSWCGYETLGGIQLDVLCASDCTCPV